MEIKVLCDCGTKYKFECEPVNGRVPFAVACPNCGVDGSTRANARVQEILSAAISTPPANPPAVAAAPGVSKLRIAGLAPSTPSLEPTAGDPPPPAAPRPFVMPVNHMAPLVAPDEGLSSKFFLGLAGATLGVVVGAALWYLIFRLSGFNFRIMAVLVGFAGGLGAKLLSKDEGSSQLGMITCVFVLIGVMFTAYTIGRDRAYNFVGGLEGKIYKEEVAQAKRAVAAVPNGTEDEIRQFLAKEESIDGEKTAPSAISSRDVRMFQEVRLAHYKEMASGAIAEKDMLKTQLRWAHEEMVAEAKHTLASMPDETDQEIRVHLAQQLSFGNEKTDAQSITAEQIAEFRSQRLPELKAQASGEKKFEDLPADFTTAKEGLAKAEASDQGGWVKVLYFFSGWGIGGIGVMFLTLGLTYKICTHA